MDGQINTVQIITEYVCLLFSLCVHEAAHAYTAERCGDNTARFMGRVTLNPIPHIDPIGTVVLPLVMMTTGIPFLFGWAKPVPVNPRNFRKMGRDNVLVSLAGPASNLLLAILFACAARLAVMSVEVSPGMIEPAVSFVGIALLMVVTNLALMLFNLIPVPPLDGSHVLYEVLGSRGRQAMERIAPFGFLVIILLGGRLIAGPLGALYLMIKQFVLHGWG